MGSASSCTSSFELSIFAKMREEAPPMRRALVFLMLGACSGNGGQPFDDAGGLDATTKPDAGSDVISLGDTFVTDTGPGDAGADVQQNPDLDCLTDDAGCISCCFD